MEQENSQENSMKKKLFVRIVGVAASLAVIFLGVTQARPITFLGSLAYENTSLSALRVDPEHIVQAKGGAFSADIVLHIGKNVPKDILATFSYDNDLLDVSYIDMTRTSFLGSEKSIVSETGSIQLSGTWKEGAVSSGQDVVVARIYFRALQNIGVSELIFDTSDQNTQVTSFDGSGNILGSIKNGKITLLIQ